MLLRYWSIDCIVTSGCAMGWCITAPSTVHMLDFAPLFCEAISVEKSRGTNSTAQSRILMHSGMHGATGPGQQAWICGQGNSFHKFSAIHSALWPLGVFPLPRYWNLTIRPWWSWQDCVSYWLPTLHSCHCGVYIFKLWQKPSGPFEIIKDSEFISILSVALYCKFTHSRAQVLIP